MPDYRRHRVPGGTCFFTVNLLGRSNSLLTDRIDALRAAVRDTRARSPFHIDAWTVLPEHMHCVWTLQPCDSDCSGRWRAVKKALSKAIAPSERRSAVRRARGERGIWQRRFWEHTIGDDTDYARHVDYVHFNPVKHGLSRRRRSGRIPRSIVPSPPDCISRTGGARNCRMLIGASVADAAAPGTPRLRWRMAMRLCALRVG